MVRRLQNFLANSGIFAAVFLGISSVALYGAEPAMACSGVRIDQLSRSSRQFQLSNGLRLGTVETDVIRTLGTPIERQKGGTRCPSNRVRLRYANDTVIVLDTERRSSGSLYVPQRSHQNTRTRTNTLFDSQTLRRSRRQQLPSLRRQVPTPIVVSLITRNSQLVLDRGIRIGADLTTVLKAYGKPRFQHARNGKRWIGYRQNGETLQMRFTNNKLDTIQMRLR